VSDEEDEDHAFPKDELVDGLFGKFMCTRSLIGLGKAVVNANYPRIGVEDIHGYDFMRHSVPSMRRIRTWFCVTETDAYGDLPQNAAQTAPVNLGPPHPERTLGGSPDIEPVPNTIANSNVALSTPGAYAFSHTLSLSIGAVSGTLANGLPKQANRCLFHGTRKKRGQQKHEQNERRHHEKKKTVATKRMDLLAPH
jgi:hypothetical protein